MADMMRTPPAQASSMIKLVPTLLIWLLLGMFANPLQADAQSDLAIDEVVVFFRTSAWLDSKNNEWHVPIHGWVYEPEDSTVRKALFETILDSRYDLPVTDETRANFDHRINLMIADNERGKRIIVSIAGRTVSLPKSGVDGHFATTVVLPVEAVEKHAIGDRLPVQAVLAASATRSFAGEVLLLQPDGWGIISDIDDTVKISNINDRRGLLESTFLQDFSAVPAMAKLYSAWSAQGASLHFVSSSPWQLYSPLDEFLLQSGFPPAALELKSVRFRDRTLFNLFKKGTETKPAVIEKILARYPERRFILVGDSGEHDPEVYSRLMRDHPQQILRIYIRNVSNSSSGDERFAELFGEIDRDRWELFDSAETFLPVELSCCADF